ncbi:MAG TPA: 2-phospho-L-lactate transferase, partial [Chloroflexota bacterium]|nr:2-phospho-L-lactate transferase [Chloroflexota bacterium]
IGGQAVKGPAAKMMQEMGMAVSATAVAQYYDDLVDLFIYDRQDEGAFVGVGGTAVALDTMMLDADGRERVAREVLQSSLDYLSA